MQLSTSDREHRRTGEEAGSSTSLLMIDLAGERYALPSNSVREIVRFRIWTPVPGAPHTLPGIISQRGMILPVVDLRPLFNQPEAELGRSARFVVVQHAEIDMAFLVEAVLDLVVIAEDAVDASATSDTHRGRFVRGVLTFDERLVGLLDLDAIIAALREGS